MVRALHFGRFYSSYFGGLERHVALLLDGLSRSIRVDNLVAADGWRGDVIQAGGYEVIRVPSFGVVAGTALCPTMPWAARRLWRERRYDIAHLHLPDPLSHLVTYFLPPRAKLVLSWHSDIVRQRQFLRVYGPMLRRLVARADAVIAATPRHFASSTQLPPEYRAKYFVVPYGIDHRALESPAHRGRAQRIRERYGERKLIFAVGRHVYYKGFEYLIPAMRDVPNATLILAGSGPLWERNRDLVHALGLGDRIDVTGRISEDELIGYLHAADVFCMPSTEPSEAFGLVQVEAMFCRTPVVCCELNNGVTYVNRDGETGLVVPPRDTDALAAALNRLLEDDDQRRRFGEAGYARALSEFTLEAMWNGTLDVYRRILGHD